MTEMTEQQLDLTAISPDGSVATKSFAESNGMEMEQEIKHYLAKKYAVIITKTVFNVTHHANHELRIGIDHQLVIVVSPKWVDCTCNEGIYCPLNTQHVNDFEGAMA